LVTRFRSGITQRQVAKSAFFIIRATYNNSPRFSQDGKKVAFASQRSGGHGDWTCDAAGCSDPQTIDVSESGEWDAPVVSDGKRIVLLFPATQACQI